MVVWLLKWQPFQLKSASQIISFDMFSIQSNRRQKTAAPKRYLKSKKSTHKMFTKSVACFVSFRLVLNLELCCYFIFVLFFFFASLCMHLSLIICSGDVCARAMLDVAWFC